MSSSTLLLAAAGIGIAWYMYQQKQNQAPIVPSAQAISPLPPATITPPATVVPQVIVPFTPIAANGSCDPGGFDGMTSTCGTVYPSSNPDLQQPDYLTSCLQTAKRYGMGYVSTDATNNNLGTCKMWNFNQGNPIPTAGWNSYAFNIPAAPVASTPSCQPTGFPGTEYSCGKMFTNFPDFQQDDVTLDQCLGIARDQSMPWVTTNATATKTGHCSLYKRSQSNTTANGDWNSYVYHRPA